jgi:hypothetical protein
MGFLRPKPPQMPPMPTPPTPPVAITEDLPADTKKDILEKIKKKSSGYTDTILTSMRGDESEVDTKKKTLLGS